MKRSLPLFPLQTVLFPGADLPLQVFEPRYREMLRDCMAGDRKFGVALIKSGDEVGGKAEPFSVGTIARIMEIGSPRRGAIPIKVTGEQRFRALSFNYVHAYMSAEVEMIEDDPADVPQEEAVSAALDATRRYLRSVLAAQGAFKPDLEVPSDPSQLSYFMGMAAAAAPVRSLQTILEAERITERLQAGIALLDEETDHMSKLFMRSGPGRNRALFSSN